MPTAQLNFWRSLTTDGHPSSYDAYVAVFRRSICTPLRDQPFSLFIHGNHQLQANWKGVSDEYLHPLAKTYMFFRHIHLAATEPRLKWVQLLNFD